MLQAPVRMNVAVCNTMAEMRTIASNRQFAVDPICGTPHAPGLEQSDPT